MYFCLTCAIINGFQDQNIYIRDRAKKFRVLAKFKKIINQLPKVLAKIFGIFKNIERNLGICSYFLRFCTKIIILQIFSKIEFLLPLFIFICT